VQTIEQQIRSFVQDTFLIGQDGESLSGSTSFLENGLIDSTGVLELVSFIEETWLIKVSDDELVPENLDSISQVTRFVQRKLGGRVVETAA
jgi:acyl carrier protein